MYIHNIFCPLLFLSLIVDSQTAGIGNDGNYSSKKYMLIDTLEIKQKTNIIDLSPNNKTFGHNDILYLLEPSISHSPLYGWEKTHRERVIFLLELMETNPNLKDFVIREMLAADIETIDSLAELKKSISFIIAHPSPTSFANLKATRDAQFNLLVEKYTRPYLRRNDIDLIALTFAIIELLKKF